MICALAGLSPELTLGQLGPVLGLSSNFITEMDGITDAESIDCRKLN